MAISIPIKCRLCGEVFRVQTADVIVENKLPRICSKCLTIELVHGRKKEVRND